MGAAKTPAGAMAAAELKPGSRLRIQYVLVDEVARWDRNPKRHDLDGLKAAFRKYGFRDAPIFDGTLDALAAGNGRATALQEMQDAGEDVPEGVAIAKDTGKWAMPVQLGLDAETVKLAEAFAIDHNNLTVGGSGLTPLDVASMWEATEYLAVTREIGGDLITVTQEELEQLELSLDLPAPIEQEPVGPQVERAEELRQEWGVEIDQLWYVGDHMLACVDSRETWVWEKLLDGKQIRWVWTDPPYGVSYVGRTADRLVMDSDDPEDALALWSVVCQHLDFFAAPGCVFYVAHPSGPLSVEFGQIFKEQGWLYHQTLTWVKNVMVMGHSDYHYQHEPIIYGWKQGAEHVWNGGRDKVSTLFYDRPSKSTWHPTMKPVNLIEHCLMNSSKVGAWGVDPFIGSGSTMVAAHVLDRRCVGMDADARYIAVTLQRMADLGVEIDGPHEIGGP